MPERPVPRHRGATLQLWRSRSPLGALGHRLRALGVGKGDRVAVQVEKSPQAVFLYLACLRIGAVYLPLNTGYTLRELDYFFGDAEPRVIVCDPARESDVRRRSPARARVVTLDADGEGSLIAGATDAGDLEPVACAADDLAALLYTSGTTGRSKGAMLTHRNLASNALALRETWGFTAADVLLHVLPIYHTHGLFVAINTVLLAGARMLFLPRFDPDAVIPALAQATVMMGVPTYYTRLLARADFTAEAARADPGVHLGLGAAARGDFCRLRGAHRPAHPRALRHDRDRHEHLQPAARRAPRRHGRPAAAGRRGAGRGRGRQAASSAARSASSRCAGRTCSRATGACPRRPREEFRDDGFFITGDIGVIGEDGYVSIVGRAKDLVISGGLNVYPKEVESLIDSLPGVVESAVVGLPHPDFGEAVAAVVVRERGATITEIDIVTAARTELAGFKVPKTVFFVEALPRNSMGKVQKNVLRADYGDTFR